MEELLESSKLSALKPQTIVEGTIIEILDSEIVVDVGGKSEAIVPTREFANLEDFSIGDSIDLLIEKLERRDGSIGASYDKAQQIEHWERVTRECQEGSTVSGRIKGKVKGGFVVDVGFDAFMPASQLDMHAPASAGADFIGKTFDFKVIKVNLQRRNLVVSRRELLEENRHLQQQQLLKNISVGSVLEGTIKNITDYGAFVDLGGVDGLLHITDMRWGRVSHPGEIGKVGDLLKVMVLDIDQDRDRISLGTKQLTPNPWENIERNYPVGARVKGKVVNLVPYGAFVELEEGVEGLVHVSEFSWVRVVKKPSDFLKIGSSIEAMVIGIQKDSKRISLSVKQTRPNPWDQVPRDYPVGARVKGKVVNLAPYGAFVELEEGIDGLVHISDMSWTSKAQNPAVFLEKGQEVEALVLSVDAENQRIALGIKQLIDNPWDTIAERFSIGQVVEGLVKHITSYGAFIELEEGIDGLVHLHQISEEKIEKVSDVLKVGDQISARVLKIEAEEQRISLSIKATHYDNEKMVAEVACYEKINLGQELGSLGDALEDIRIETKSDSKPQ